MGQKIERWSVIAFGILMLVFAAREYFYHNNAHFARFLTYMVSAVTAGGLLWYSYFHPRQ